MTPKSDNVTSLPTAALPPGRPVMPEWESLYREPAEQQRAAELWSVVVAEMENAGTLAPVNGEAIRRYCIAAVLYDHASAQVASAGPVIDRLAGQLPAWNLWFSAMRDAAGMMDSLESELGLSPRRRSMVSPAKRKKASGASAAYLGAGAKGG